MGGIALLMTQRLSRLRARPWKTSTRTDMGFSADIGGKDRYRTRTACGGAQHLRWRAYAHLQVVTAAPLLASSQSGPALASRGTRTSRRAQRARRRYTTCSAAVDANISVEGSSMTFCKASATIAVSV